MKTRWNKQELKENTGYSQTASQAQWFKDNFGIDVPRDRLGVIMNDNTFQRLLDRKCGLTSSTGEKMQPQKKPSLRI